MCLYPYGRVARKSRTWAIHDITPLQGCCPQQPVGTTSPSSQYFSPRRALSFKIFLCCGAYCHCPSIITHEGVLLSSPFGNPQSKLSSVLPSWWSRYPDCRYHAMVVGLILTAYRLLSHWHPRCLWCSTPHVMVFPFLCGSTLFCDGFCVTFVLLTPISPFDPPRHLRAKSGDFP
jgi:hypothetical protein